MMPRIPNKIALAILCASTTVLASPGREGGVGNGGEAYVCYARPKTAADPQPPIVSAEIRDGWEWRNTSNHPLRLGAPDLTVDQKMAKVFARIARFEPYAVEDLRRRYEELKQRMKVTVDGEIPEMKDSTAIVSAEANCYFEPLVFNRRVVGPFEAKFIFRRSIWERISRSND